MPLFSQISLLFLLTGSEALTQRYDADSILTSQECCDAIRTEFASIVHGPASNDYSDRLSTYYSQQQHDYSPACYVKPKSTEDISKILKIAASHHCQFAVASGGHMAWAEASNTDDGFVFDLRDMNRIYISVERQTVSLGPGSKWISVYKAMDAHNLTVPGARMSDVGVGGFLAGGGYPFTSKTPGFGANSVFNYEVVLSDGTIVEANADSHSDLFWALKLAGTNYGIITRFDMNADASTEIWGAVGLYPSTEQTRTEIFPAYEEYSHRNDNTDLFISVGHLKAMGRPEKPMSPVEPVIYNEKTGQRNEVIHDPIDSLLQTPSRTAWFTLTIKVSTKLFLDFGKKAADVFALLEDAPGFSTMLGFQPFPKKFIEGNRGSPVYNTMKESDEDLTRELVQKEARNLDLLVNFTYLNYANKDQPVYEQSLTPEDLARMLRIRDKYDPSAIFRTLWKGGYKLPETPTARDEL
ncbi:hypothetical protein TRIATDRAFT_269378 [Trichoderma atroviride IMI 206040]|uniref:FAD-binding PCMH-type domain-containing protein n=1 Tax=Hypocrea atroviridis (strain ATCC 20476 / IMI 206040) TaxID=452589 RepID=G9NE05_HYPAI|nr:uncharacterized protein TRIATDRAFT_269378 [Trichoderma atroviride IMI 206040]EHK51139.1 hypothetical protein TRIATDRAFT_269378 [Trichoderma atroviride IMI 206040]